MPLDDTSYVGKSAYHGALAANYERDRIGEEIWHVEQAWVENWLRSLKPEELILDLPVGTGRFTEPMLARGLRVHASDISTDMLQIAERRAEGALGRLTFAQDDVEALPYEDDAFDHVISWRLFHLLPPMVAARAVRQLARVCRRRLVIQFFGVAACPWWRDQARVLKTFFKATKAVPVDKRHREGENPWAHIRSYPYTERGLARLFDQCGLDVLEQQTLGDYSGVPARVYVLQKRRTLR